MGCILSSCSKTGDINHPNTHPLLTVPDVLLDLTLKQVSVPTSHNSYLNGFQHLSFASCSAIQEALECGARCIELDVFCNKDNMPIVAHGTVINRKNNKFTNLLTTMCIDFKEAMHTISAFETKDPLFICLELNTQDNNQVHDNMVEILESQLASRLIKGDVSNISLRDLMGKVVLLAGNGSSGRLQEMINIIWGRGSTYNRSSGTLVSELPQIGTMIGRIYPQGDLRGALSLNYDPEPFINAGVTFVALNYNNLSTKPCFHRGFVRIC
jgi:hypothetical protein